MGERPDEVRRDPLTGDGTDRDPLAAPTGTTGGEARPVIGPDPALGGGIGGGAVVDEAEVERAEIERTRAEIERTRADMSETVDAIQERLSPENLKEQAKDRVREATVGRAQEAGSGIVETIRANPLPAALTGIGLGWLFVSARRSSSAQPRYRDSAYAYDHPTASGYPPRYEESSTTSTPSAGQALERARDRVGETASQAQDQAEQVASQAQDKAGQVASQAQDQVSLLSDQARHQAQRASGGFQRMLQENPLTVGALAVGVGAAVGLAIPQTSQEHEVMGEARDTLVEKAQEKAEEAQLKVQQVAQEAQSAAQQEAENQGLTNQ
jgi:ElaB/YqjD/DUF883 family membrane-anchored ribosome-binding protein